VGLGIVGFHLMFITSISFNFRKQTGQKRWRQLHYATFGVYGLATVHGAMVGIGSGNAGMRLLYGAVVWRFSYCWFSARRCVKPSVHNFSTIFCTVEELRRVAGIFSTFSNLALVKLLCPRCLCMSQ